MANEFVAKNGLISQNNTTVSGSLTVTQGITGSFSGSLTGTATTASYVLQAVSASFATTASYALTSAGGGGTSGISQGKVVAISTGYSNLF
jgi:hypothetical protein